MNGQPDVNLFRLLTENPEFMQKAISIASSLASSGILSGQFGQTGTGNQPSQSPSSYNNSPPSQSGYENRTGEVNPLANIVQGLDLSSLLSGADQSASREKEGHQGDGSAQSRNEKPPSAKEGSAFAKASHAERIRLLEAMRPFVPEHRREKLDFVIRLMGLIEVADKLGLKNIIGGR